MTSEGKSKDWPKILNPWFFHILMSFVHFSAWAIISPNSCRDIKITSSKWSFLKLHKCVSRKTITIFFEKTPILNILSSWEMKWENRQKTWGCFCGFSKIMKSKLTQNWWNYRFKLCSTGLKFFEGIFLLRNWWKSTLK